MKGTGACPTQRRDRPLIAFFDYPDVFEDFYPHYGVNQRSFATRWAGSGNHAFLALLQREVGDVIWYAGSLAPELGEARHEVVGCRVKFFPSSWLHRQLWRLFYLPRVAWRLVMRTCCATAFCSPGLSGLRAAFSASL